MRLALDTNAYSNLQKGMIPNLEQLIKAPTTDQLILPFNVVGELRGGFRKGHKTSENYQILERFIAQDRVSVFYADEETIEIYANVWADLSKKGTKIPTNDLWIASICLQHGCALATSDRHFNHVPLLQTIKLD